TNIADLSKHTTRYISPVLTQKVFANMRRVGKGFLGVETPLFETRVKKLEKINKVKSSKLRRLKKVGSSQRVESSDDVENVFNQGRIIIDMDEGIELEEINKEHEEAYKNIDRNAALDHVQSKEPQYIKRYHGIKKKP
nr:hypothetical protein [Tanacetum cinerariifolium]